ncbi:aldo/keto reductase [Mumia sp. zg.B17]|uniref:aldo/keto reductase n=1 Tax=Mumia sp. zg.B17 TaxID=2855446 RepID=UPI001C6EEEBC|nr:aldo/keto reductase [Mumia sp. zg.B17]MBW9205616.1 aldo/keto reductase [Mumia sp. zg.B17]
MSLMSIELGDGLRVSAQGFGGMALTAVYGGTDPDTALATLAHAVDLGVTFVDTANVYGDGTNEELIGRLLADRRDEVQLATKFGVSGDITTGERVARGDAPYVRECLEASLTRLGTDVVDLYYLHRLDPDVPIEETVGAMAELVHEGKVRHLGLSEVTADELRRAHAVHPVAAVQSEWSIWSRDVERHVVPAAIELGVGFVPYSPLGRGFLAGSVDVLPDGDMRHTFPRFGAEALDANQVVVQTVRRVADEVGATPAQVALAWLYEHGRRLGLPVVPIPGTRRATRVDENVGAVSVRLDAASLAMLDDVSSAVVGDRSADPTWVSAGRE